MPNRRAKYGLWVALLVTLPVPYLLPQSEWAPVVRLAFLSAAVLALRFTEGAGGWVWMTLQMMGIFQTLLWATAMYGLAAGTTRSLERLAPEPWAPRLQVALIGALAVASTFPIYWTPISSRAVISNVWGLFQ